MNDFSINAANRPGTGGRPGGLIRAELKVSGSDDGQYLLIHAGQRLLAIYGAMGADPEIVEFADGGRFSVEQLLDMAAAE